MNRKLSIVALVAPAIFLLDQITKLFVVRLMPLGTKHTVWENFFDLVHVRNRGAAFGVLAGWESSLRDFFFYALALLAIIFLFQFLRDAPKLLTAVPVGLILGGALGNVTDRIFRGSVVDFLSFHYRDAVADFSLFGHRVFFDLTWPAFNVADSAITSGVVWLVFLISRPPQPVAE